MKIRIFSLAFLLFGTSVIEGIIEGVKTSIQTVPYIVYGQGEPGEQYRFTGIIIDSNLVLTYAEICEIEYALRILPCSTNLFILFAEFSKFILSLGGVMFIP